MMALRAINAKKTLIASLALIVIGKMPGLFVRRKRVRVNFVGQIVSVRDIVNGEDVMMALKVIFAKKTLIVKDIVNLENVMMAL